MSTSTFPKFMDFPIELRLEIYELFLPKNEKVSFGNMSSACHPPQASAALTHHLGQYLLLTQISRQVRDEATSILYGQNTFEVILRADKVIVGGNPPSKPAHKRQGAKKHANRVTDRAPVYDLIYGDRHAAAWARVARPETIAQIKRFQLVVEKADAIVEWKFLRHLALSPSSPSLERTGLFSAYKWYMHAIELKCPGRDPWIWELNSTQYHVDDKNDKSLALLKRTDDHQACSRCSLMLGEWRTISRREGVTSREHFLGLVWYACHESPFV